jgi:hypothetical protein
MIMAYMVYFTDGRFGVLSALLTFQICWDVTLCRLVLAELTSQNTWICFYGICDMAHVPRNAKKMLFDVRAEACNCECPWTEFLPALRWIHLYLQWMHVRTKYRYVAIWWAALLFREQWAMHSHKERVWNTCIPTLCAFVARYWGRFENDDRCILTVALLTLLSSLAFLV